MWVHILALKAAILKVNIHIIYTNLLNQRWNGKWPRIRKRRLKAQIKKHYKIKNQQNVSSQYV